MPPWANARVEAWDGFLTWPLPNVWLGVSVGSRHFVSRADLLRQTPAVVRFISAEPLIGPVIYDASEMEPDTGAYNPCWSDGRDGPELNLDGIDWCIAGGESGPGHRPMDEAWARALRCEAGLRGTAFFMKQMGGARPGDSLDALPDDLRTREFPTGNSVTMSAVTRSTS
jgi:protein gp37